MSTSNSEARKRKLHPEFKDACFAAEEAIGRLRMFETGEEQEGDALDHIDWQNIHQAYWAIRTSGSRA